ncbi:MAG: sigma-70 family RNA polymerase sigma factor [Planctomycetes bacterium]|nr:sigma-70 family RNA polymerase sigma factor [Planctomycetota bacterium]
MEEDKGKLAEAAAAGDAQAVARLLELHMPELRAFVRLRAGHEVRKHESSSDIVQSVCREVLQNIERFKHPSPAAFKQWLYTTAMRKISNRADYWRAEKREAARERSIPSEADQQSLLRCYHSFSSPSRGLIVREEIERIERAFELLSEEQREIVTLAHIVGMSRAEIAEKIGKSEGSVRVTLHRALARLSELLSD